MPFRLKNTGCGVIMSLMRQAPGEIFSPKPVESREGAAMSVYMIIDSKIKDREKYEQYIEQVSPIVAKHGGRYHVRGENIRPLGTWRPVRIIVIEFPSEDHIRRWFASPEYAAIAPLREEGADTQAILVDGYSTA